MPTITYDSAETAAVAHFAAQTAYGSAGAAPVSAQLRAVEEIRPLASILAKHKAGIENSVTADTTRTANTIFSGPSTGSPAAATFRTLVAADLPTVPYTKGGTGLTTLGAPLQVVRTNAAGTAFEHADPAGGGYSMLTASGANNGIFTFYDSTATTGETRVVIREGADLSGFENLFEIQNNGGTSQWYIGGANNDFRTYMPTSGIVDANERYFRVSSGGFKAPSDGSIGFTDGTNVYAAYDAYFGRSAAGVVDVLTTAAALAKLRCADLAVLGGDVSVGAADSGGAGFKVLRIPN